MRGREAGGIQLSKGAADLRLGLLVGAGRGRAKLLGAAELGAAQHPPSPSDGQHSALVTSTCSWQARCRALLMSFSGSWWVLAGAGWGAGFGRLPGWVVDGMAWVLQSVLAGAMPVCCLQAMLQRGGLQPDRQPSISPLVFRHRCTATRRRTRAWGTCCSCRVGAAAAWALQGSAVLSQLFLQGGCPARHCCVLQWRCLALSGMLPCAAWVAGACLHLVAIFTFQR